MNNTSVALDEICSTFNRGSNTIYFFFLHGRFSPFILFKAAKSVEIAEAFSIFDTDIN